MGWIATARRKAIHQRDKCQCVYCGKRGLLRDLMGSQEWALDHIVPRALGGSNATENLITACQLCNSRKGRMTLKNFLRMNENEYNVGRTAKHCLRVIAYRTSKPINVKGVRI